MRVTMKIPIWIRSEYVTYIGIPSVSYLPRLEMITGLNITTSIKPMFTIIIFFFTPISHAHTGLPIRLQGIQQISSNRKIRLRCRLRGLS